MSMDNKLCRIAVFYDGTYFFKVSNYYLYQHERRARLSFKGLHAFIVSEVAKYEGREARHCQIVDAAYFRGRLSAQMASEHDKLYSDRLFEDVLMKANVTLFQRHLRIRPDGGFEEKGIDVWMALEAYEMANLKNYDVCVLVTGDGDFVPLVNKLNTLGARVMLLGWDFNYERDGRIHITQAATELIERVNYPIMMDTEIDARERRNDALINGLFTERGSGGAPERFQRESYAPGPAAASGVSGADRKGTILNYFPDKGFGFIRPDSGGENFFFHVNETEDIDPDDLMEGMRVVFVPGQNDRGLAAYNVREIFPE